MPYRRMSIQDLMRESADEVEGIITREQPVSWWVDMLYELKVPKNTGVQQCKAVLEAIGFTMTEAAVERIVRRRKHERTPERFR